MKLNKKIKLEENNKTYERIRSDEKDESINSKVKKKPNQLASYIDQHFIFNTLNGLLALCRDDSEKARKVVLELSNYLRFNFNITDEVVFLYEEIEYIKAYLYIQKVRFGERLNIKYDIKGDINFLIPKNSLYNLIDNAVNHGILKKNQGGTITFIVKRDKEKISIKIEDDGVGIEEKQVMQILSNENFGSISTSNSQYNALYNTEMEIITELYKGTYITLNIPIENIKHE